MRIPAVLAFAIVASIAVFATIPDASGDPMIDGEFEYELDSDGNAIVVGYRGDSPDVSIPETVDGHIVVSVNIDGAWDTVNKLHLSRYVQTLTASDGVAGSLQEFTVDYDNEFLAAEDGILYSHDMKTLIAVPWGISGMLSIASGVEAIGVNALTNLSNVDVILFPDSLTGCGFNVQGNPALVELVMGKSMDGVGMTVERGSIVTLVFSGKPFDINGLEIDYDPDKEYGDQTYFILSEDGVFVELTGVNPAFRYPQVITAVFAVFIIVMIAICFLAFRRDR